MGYGDKVIAGEKGGTACTAGALIREGGIV